MRPIPEVTAEQENFRTEQMEGYPNISFVKRDSVEPVPIGTIVAHWFRVVGYDQDCDGSLMARLENLNSEGGTTGWCPDHLGLYPDSGVILDGPDELMALTHSYAKSLLEERRRVWQKAIAVCEDMHCEACSNVLSAMLDAVAGRP